MIFYDIKQVVFFVIYTWFNYKNHLKIHTKHAQHPHLSKVTLKNSLSLIFIYFKILKHFKQHRL